MPAAVETKSMDNKETMRFLTERAEAQGDLFRIKVVRRAQVAGGYHRHLGTFDGVRLGHLSDAELWLPQFAGGSTYGIDVYHDKDKVNPVGRLTFYVEGSELEVDPNITKRPGWAGPPILLLPEARAERAPPEQTQFSPYSPRGSLGSPSTVAPQEAFASGRGAPPGASLSSETRLAGLEMLLENKLHRIDEKEQRRELEAVRLENQRNLESYQRQIRDLELKMAETRNVTPPKGGGDTIAALAAALGPLVTEMIKSNNEARIEALRMQQAQAHEQQKMLAALMTRPQIDPMMEKLLDKFDKMSERAQENRSDAYDGAAKIAEANARMMSGTIRAMQAVTEMLDDGKQDHPAMLIFREGMEALKSITAGLGKAATPPRRAPPQAAPGPNLPPPAQMRPGQKLPVPPQEYVPVKPLPQGGAQVDPALSAPQPAAPAPQAPVTATTAPANGSSGAPNGTPNGAQEHPAAPTIVDKLEYMIRNHIEPLIVARLFIASLGEEALEAELDAVNRYIPTLLDKRLGSEWFRATPENEAYGIALMAALDAENKRIGDDGEEEEDDAAAEDNDGKENNGEERQEPNEEEAGVESA